MSLVRRGRRGASRLSVAQLGAPVPGAIRGSRPGQGWPGERKRERGNCVQAWGRGGEAREERSVSV